MFIDTIPNRKSPPAVLLRESYRDGGRVKKRTLANLSKLPQALIAGIAALLDGGKVSGKRAAEPGFEIVRSLPHGHVAAVQAMIRKLGLERTLQGGTGVDKRVRNLFVEHHMRNALAPILFADHQPEARERASIVAPAQPSPAAVEKCTKRRAADGTPIMAWHDLIGQLGTLTINEVALPLGERRTIQMLARPTALQEQAFALLGVPPPRVQ